MDNLDWGALDRRDLLLLAGLGGLAGTAEAGARPGADLPPDSADLLAFVQGLSSTNSKEMPA
jgi:hypothetical protein